MSIEADTSFAGKSISYFVPNDKNPIPNNRAVGLRITSEWENLNITFDDYLAQFFAQQWIFQIESLVIGFLDFDLYDGYDDVISIIVENKHNLPHLKSLYIGNVSSYEFEISWIAPTNLSPILEAFPSLEILKLRGAGGYFNQNTHLQIKTIIMESAGLDERVPQQLMQCHFHNLEHLELWLGKLERGYGKAIPLNDFEPLFNKNLFSKLTYLGLKNNYQADQYAIALADSKLLKQLKVLDLSLGTLTDLGAEYLLEIADLSHLELLDLHFHFLSDEMVNRFAKLSITVDTTQKNPKLIQEILDDDPPYYIFISE